MLNLDPVTGTFMTQLLGQKDDLDVLELIEGSPVLTPKLGHIILSIRGSLILDLLIGKIIAVLLYS